MPKRSTSVKKTSAAKAAAAVAEAPPHVHESVTAMEEDDIIEQAPARAKRGATKKRKRDDEEAEAVLAQAELSEDEDVAKAPTRAKRSKATTSAKSTTATGAKKKKTASVAANDADVPYLAHGVSHTLGRVSADVAHRIWTYLDTDSLAILNMTHNRSITRLMCSKGAVAKVVIDSRVMVAKWKVLYLLESLNEVGLLQIETSFFEPIELVHALRSANPRELAFGEHLVKYDFLNSLPNSFDPKKASAGDIAAGKHFTRAGLPNFAKLTPNLKCLRFLKSPRRFGTALNYTWYDGWDRDGVPPPWVRARPVRAQQYCYGCNFDDLYLPTPSPAGSRTPTSGIESVELYDFTDIVLGLPETIINVTFNECFPRDDGSTSFPYLLTKMAERFKSLRSITVKAKSKSFSEQNWTVKDATVPSFETLESFSIANFSDAPNLLNPLSVPSMPFLTTLDIGLTLNLPVWAGKGDGKTHVGQGTLGSGASAVNTWSLSHTMPALRSLHLTIYPSSKDKTTSAAVPILPPHLSKLSIVVTKGVQDKNALGLLFGQINSLASLEELILGIEEDSKKLPFTLSLAGISGVLKTLKLNGHAFGNILEQEMQHFPASLKLLSMSHATLALAQSFVKLHPKTLFVMTDFVEALGDGKDLKQLNSDFPPANAAVFDNSAFLENVHRSYVGKNVVFDLRWEVDKFTSNISKTPGNFMCSAAITSFIYTAPPRYAHSTLESFPDNGVYPGHITSKLPGLQKLVLRLHPVDNPALGTEFLPKKLVHLELLNVELIHPGAKVDPSLLPETLTHIQSNAKFATASKSLTLYGFPGLTYLDTPHWNWKANLFKWKDTGMTRFAAHLSGLEDTKWVDLFKTKFHRRTLGNMSVSLTFTLTGAYLPAKGMKRASADAKCLATQIALSKLFQDTKVTAEVEDGKKKKTIELAISSLVHDTHATAGTFAYDG